MLDPNKRITAAEALEHNYFQSAPLPATIEEIAKAINIKN